MLCCYQFSTLCYNKANYPFLINCERSSPVSWLLLYLHLEDNLGSTNLGEILSTRHRRYLASKTIIDLSNIFKNSIGLRCSNTNTTCTNSASIGFIFILACYFEMLHGTPMLCIPAVEDSHPHETPISYPHASPCITNEAQSR